MHQPRPYGLHVIGLPLTDKDESFISSVAVRISNLKELSGIDSMKMVYDLPDGGYVIVQDMGGNFRVIAHKPIHGKDIIFDGIATDYIPMLFSGVITRATVFENQAVGVRLTEDARFRLVNYSHLDTKPTKDIELQRFRIDYDNKFSEFKPPSPSAILRTQYTQLRPTWYSGAMAEAMQIVGGYGRQDFAQLPDEKVNRFERARVKLPKDVMDSINKELKAVRLPAYTGLPVVDGSFQFDYKFNNTNAIGFDDKQKPWLLRISPSGVYAMPLPIVPATRTDAFRRYMHLMGDNEILAILDRFGGMPSGESFPSYESFEAWRRAGVIIKVCDVSDFYSHVSYSSACGWSLNSRGDEGYNTCYDYYDDEGLGYGLTYKLKLQLKSSDEYYGADAVELVENGPIADKVRSYLQNLLPDIGNATGKDRAILYKLRRAKSEVIYQRALGRSGKDDKDYWHNLEMTPIANHQGSVSEIGRGYLYHPAKFNAQPQIKFPEPLMGGCISHDFLPLENGRYKDKYPNSDTIMFAYYVGNDLKVVKYFIDWGSFEREVITDYEKYMRAGSWYRYESTGKTAIQGYFYSSDIDDRDYVSPTTIDTIVVGTDRGYDSKPRFQFDSFYSMAGSMWRNRYYSHKTNSTTISGKSLSVAICIPYLCRNSAINAYKETITSKTDSESVSLHAVRDPTGYRYWTYDSVFAWAGGTTMKNPKGMPYPKNGNPVWVEEVAYNPSEAADFADNGDWVGGMPADYTWLIHPDSNAWLNSGGGGAPTVSEYSVSSEPVSKAKGNLKFSIGNPPNNVHANIPEANYFIGSPDDFGGVFYKDACKIVFGEATYHNLSEPTNQYSRARWGYSKLVDHKSAHHFIGVINE